jgi:hypothetical protein
VAPVRDHPIASSSLPLGYSCSTAGRDHFRLSEINLLQSPRALRSSHLAGLAPTCFSPLRDRSMAGSSPRDVEQPPAGIVSITVLSIKPMKLGKIFPLALVERPGGRRPRRVRSGGLTRGTWRTAARRVGCAAVGRQKSVDRSDTSHEGAKKAQQPADSSNPLSQRRYTSRQTSPAHAEAHIS